MCNTAMRSHWGKHHSKSCGKGHGNPWRRTNSIQRHLFPPVNVEELDDRYEISLFAAGYSKSDYLITFVDEELNVSAKKVKLEETSQEEDKQTWQKREFKPRGFERRFILNNKIDKEAMSAKFKDGVVTITLPKLAGQERVRREIEID